MRRREFIAVWWPIIKAAGIKAPAISLGDPAGYDFG